MGPFAPVAIEGGALTMIWLATGYQQDKRACQLDDMTIVTLIVQFQPST